MAKVLGIKAVWIFLPISYIFAIYNIRIASDIFSLDEYHGEGIDQLAEFLNSSGEEHEKASIVDTSNPPPFLLPSSAINTTRTGKVLMVIAACPKSNIQYDVIWSQLECFTEKVDQIVIAADNRFKENVTEFLHQVNSVMPETGRRLKAQFHSNDRYDSGLWCDTLFQENVLKNQTSSEQKDNRNDALIPPSIITNSSSYDRFILINDSMMAVENSNELLDVLESKDASFISLSYWDKDLYWLESAARAFNEKGIEIFANGVCSLPTITKDNLKQFCPHLNERREKFFRKKKRCIVEKTETFLAKHFLSDEVHGLYRGHDPNGLPWGSNYTYWKYLRDEMSFPAVKVKLFKKVIQNGRSHEFDRCTRKRRNKMGINNMI